jgi:hypothetical protein
MTARVEDGSEETVEAKADSSEISWTVAIEKIECVSFRVESDYRFERKTCL